MKIIRGLKESAALCKAALMSVKFGRKGQSMTEYLLMFSAVLGFIVIIFVQFYDSILGRFFTLIGLAIPEK
ncbi:MAG: hypothetical protein NTW04_05780 [Elusimicrobia bacterium]|nr:hypothetical protein [Elusimicrobiota bacterium]